jgi:N-acetylmuramoyl-L-alanine amidase
MIKQLIRVLTLMMLFCSIGAHFANATMTDQVYINGKKVSKGTSIIWNKNEFYLPTSFYQSELGISVIKTGTSISPIYTLRKGSTVVTLKLNQNQIWVNGKAQVATLPLLLKDGVAHVAIRKVAASFALKANWDAISEAVMIYTKSGSSVVNASQAPQPTISPTPSVTPTPTPTPIASVGKLNRIEYIAGGIAFDASGYTNVKHVYQASTNAAELNKIVIDIEGLAATSGTMDGGKVYVDRLQYGMLSSNSNVCRITISLKKDTGYTVQSDMKTGLITLLFTESTPIVTNNDGKYIVVVDAGHGGKDPGAPSISKKTEKDLNLIIAKKIAAKLGMIPNVTVLMTRNEDVYLTLEERAAFANNNNANLFISVHANTNERASINGVETYYMNDMTVTNKQSERSLKSAKFAALIHKETLLATGFLDRKIKSADYRVLVKTRMPAILMETGYLSNVQDDQKLWTSIVQDRIASGVQNAVKSFLLTNNN